VRPVGIAWTPLPLLFADWDTSQLSEVHVHTLVFLELYVILTVESRNISRRSPNPIWIARTFKVNPAKSWGNFTAS
jgi:hypothetical protein